MKRSNDSSSHTAVGRFQPLEAIKRPLVADDAGNGPAAGGIGSLALCAGLWLWHVSGRLLVAADVLGAAIRNLASRPAANRSSVQTDDEGAIGFSGNGHDACIPVQLAVHLGLRAGPIPTMCLGYLVTSDTSTTVHRVAA